MTVLERKVRFARTVLDENFDEKLFEELEWMLSILSAPNKAPCSYSNEELNERALQSVSDSERGYGKTMKEMREKYSGK